MQRSGISTPIYGILYDGRRFRFFLFDGSTKPYKFSEGVVPGSRLDEGLHLEDFSSKHAAHSFVLALRPICEAIFNLFLVTYCATLKVFREQIKIDKHERLGSLAKWDQAIDLAEEALEKSQHAEALRQDNSIINADATAETALEALKQRYIFVAKFSLAHELTYQRINSVDLLPKAFKIDHLMDDLDWDELAKV